MATKEIAQLEATVFGRVLLDLAESRGYPARVWSMHALAEQAGLDGEGLIRRMSDASAPDLGPLDKLAEVLELDTEEMVRLALAYSLEEEPESPVRD